MNDRYGLYHVLRAPRITEKATMSLEKNNQVLFEVATWANKVQIKAAVEKMFSVQVKDVQTMNCTGKSKRFGRTLGKRNDWKKAVVRLHEGFTIDFEAKG